MKMPFANSGINILPPVNLGSMPSVTGHNPFAGHLGGVAPVGPGVARRDIFNSSLFHPALTINGGLKQPPRA